MAQMILIIRNPTIKLSTSNYMTVRTACWNDHIEVTQWIFSILTQSTDYIDHELWYDAVICACIFSNLIKLKWLISVKPLHFEIPDSVHIHYDLKSDGTIVERNDDDDDDDDDDNDEYNNTTMYNNEC